MEPADCEMVVVGLWSRRKWLPDMTKSSSPLGEILVADTSASVELVSLLCTPTPGTYN
jgi:hypothetical protein